MMPAFASHRRWLSEWWWKHKATNCSFGNRLLTEGQIFGEFREVLKAEASTRRSPCNYSERLTNETTTAARSMRSTGTNEAYVKT